MDDDAKQPATPNNRDRPDPPTSPPTHRPYDETSTVPGAHDEPSPVPGTVNDSASASTDLSDLSLPSANVTIPTYVSKPNATEKMPRLDEETGSKSTRSAEPTEATGTEDRPSPPTPTPQPQVVPFEQEGVPVATPSAGTAHPSSPGSSGSTTVAVNKPFLARKRVKCGILLVFCALVATIIGLALRKGGTGTGTGTGVIDVDPDNSPDSVPSSDEFRWMFDEIYERGHLLCGVSGQLGFSMYNATTNEYVGFDAGLCRAIAAAIFGADNLNGRIEFVVLSGRDRFEALVDGEVDVLARQTTHTMEREVQEPTTGQPLGYSAPYLYNGLQVGGDPFFVDCVESVNNNGTCAETIVCVEDGTTHVAVIEDFNPDVRIITPVSGQQLYQWFIQGRCNVIASEQFNVAETTVRSAGYRGNDYAVGERLFSKEPLALVTRHDDPLWTDFVGAVLQGLLSAEEAGITRDTAGTMGEMLLFGERHANMLIDTVRAVGSYAELYQQYIQAFVPRSVADRINVGTSPLMYPLPFGSLGEVSDVRNANGVLGQVERRGILALGVVARPMFAERDVDSGEWKGLDIDYGKAISAAVFSGDSTRVQFIELEEGDAPRALAEGEVDVASIDHTLDVDVKKPELETGLSFSPPIYFGGITFGGKPPFARCADQLDSASEECTELMICVTENHFATVSEYFHKDFVMLTDSMEAAISALAAGSCNVVAGDALDVTLSNVRNGGYSASARYETGVNRFSKRIAALATREDDALWSRFVFWTVTALMYAEEEGVTQSTASSMPEVYVFGFPFVDMMRDAVGAVGSTLEMYERNIGVELQRGGPNGINRQLSGPQHYPIPTSSE